MTRQQKKAVRKALRQYGRKQKAADAAGCAAAGPDPWGRVIRQVLDYYAVAETGRSCWGRGQQDARPAPRAEADAGSHNPYSLRRPQNVRSVFAGCLVVG